MTKEINNYKYIKISQLDFININSSRSGDSYFRSIEAYLVKNNRKYNVNDQEFIIYVSDKEDAMNIGFIFKLGKIEYFDGQELLSIILIKKRKKEERKIIIDNSTGEKINMKKLREQQYEEAKKHCLEKKEVIKRGILTKKELENAIKDNKLNEICILKRSYFDRQEIVDFIKNKKR